MTDDSPSPVEKRTRRKHLLWLLAAVFVVLSILIVAYYFLVLQWRQETDDAYVEGNVVALSAQTTGNVIAIRADETQFVKAGQALLSLDPTDAQIAQRAAVAQLADTVRQLSQQYVEVDHSDALLKQAELNLEKAKSDYQRRLPLAKGQTLSQEELAHSKLAVQTAQAALAAAKQQAKAARALVWGVSLVQHPRVLAAKANFIQAWLSVIRCTVVAPVSGYVAKRDVQIGSRVNIGTPLLSIVPLDQLWVNANFKESELRDIRIGQEATITADLYGDEVEYHGRVVGLAAGTGGAFSLLPPQNATGNWIKIVQRLPVRISLDPTVLAKYPLRLGLSMTVRVNTRSRQGPVLASQPSDQVLYQTDAYTLPLEKAEQAADAIIAQHAQTTSAPSVTAP